MPKIDDALVYGDRRRLRQKTPPEGMRKAGLVQSPCGRPGGPEQCRCKNNLLQLAMLAVGPKTPAIFQTWDPCSFGTHQDRPVPDMEARWMGRIRPQIGCKLIRLQNSNNACYTQGRFDLYIIYQYIYHAYLINEPRHEQIYTNRLGSCVIVKGTAHTTCRDPLQNVTAEERGASVNPCAGHGLGNIW
jgi:hypothetical protein